MWSGGGGVVVVVRWCIYWYVMVCGGVWCRVIARASSGIRTSYRARARARARAIGLAL